MLPLLLLANGAAVASSSEDGITTRERIMLGAGRRKLGSEDLAPRRTMDALRDNVQQTRDQIAARTT